MEDIHCTCKVGFEHTQPEFYILQACLNAEAIQFHPHINTII